MIVSSSTRRAIGLLFLAALGYLASLLRRGGTNDLAGLTIYAVGDENVVDSPL